MVVVFEGHSYASLAGSLVSAMPTTCLTHAVLLALRGITFAGEGVYCMFPVVQPVGEP